MMRHRKNSRKLGRKAAHKKATLQGIARALFIKERVRTTKVKAKEAQSFIEKLVTIARDNSPSSRRRAFSLIREKDLIEPLFNEIAPRFNGRKGGYTRIMTAYPRRGDGSPMAILEFVVKRPKKAEPVKAAKEAKKDEGVNGKTAEVRRREVEKEEEPRKPAPGAKAALKIKTDKEKALREDKRIKKSGFLNKVYRYFRGKKP